MKWQMELRKMRVYVKTVQDKTSRLGYQVTNAMPCEERDQLALLVIWWLRPSEQIEEDGKSYKSERKTEVDVFKW